MLYYVVFGIGVPLSTLLTFNRLKALSSDSEVVANALRKTKNDIIEVGPINLMHVCKNALIFVSVMVGLLHHSCIILCP